METHNFKVGDHVEIIQDDGYIYTKLGSKGTITDFTLDHAVIEFYELTCIDKLDPSESTFIIEFENIKRILSKPPTLYHF